VRVAHPGAINLVRKRQSPVVQKSVELNIPTKATDKTIRVTLAKKLGLKTHIKQQGGEKIGTELVRKNKKPIQLSTVETYNGLKEERKFYRNEAKYACTPDQQAYLNQLRSCEQQINNVNYGFTDANWSED